MSSPRKTILFRDLEWGAAFTDNDALYFDPNLPEGKEFPNFPQRERVYVRIGLTNEAIYLPHAIIKKFTDDKLVYPQDF
jgi:hypothetical protein